MDTPSFFFITALPAMASCQPARPRPYLQGLFKKSSFTNAYIAKDLNHCQPSTTESRCRRGLFRFKIHCYTVLYYLYTLLLNTVRVHDLLILSFSTFLTWMFWQVWGAACVWGPVGRTLERLTAGGGAPPPPPSDVSKGPYTAGGGGGIPP